MGRSPEPRRIRSPLSRDPLQGRAERRDAQLDRQREREQRAEHAEHRAAEHLLATADVGDHEHVQHHHCARIHHDLGGGDELGAQQQEQHRQRDQVDDQRQHAVERVADGDHADRTGDRADRADEEQDGAHSPSCLSGVRSIASSSSISLVKIRSERV